MFFYVFFFEFVYFAEDPGCKSRSLTLRFFTKLSFDFDLPFRPPKLEKNGSAILAYHNEIVIDKNPQNIQCQQLDRKWKLPLDKSQLSAWNLPEGSRCCLWELPFIHCTWQPKKKKKKVCNTKKCEPWPPRTLVWLRPVNMEELCFDMK